MNIRKDIESRMRTLLDHLVEEVRNEIIAQGHVHTGALLNSVEGIFKAEQGAFRGVIQLLDYGVILNEFDETKTSFKQIYFLQRYFKQKGFDEKEAKTIAFLTINKWMKGDKPTKASRRFSKTNKRTRFVDIAILRSEKRLEKFVNELPQVMANAYAEVINRNLGTKLQIQL